MSSKTDIKAEQYLGYLDKEMGIMGVLSAFFVTATGLFFERVMSAGKDSIMFDWLKSLVDHGSPYLTLAITLMLAAAVFFYRQRSQLAWYYGQIALEMTLPTYTRQSVEKWLKEVDSWEAWIPYDWAFWISVFAVAEFLSAVLSTHNPSFQTHAWRNALILAVLLVLLLLWVRRNSIRFKYEEERPYFRIK